MNLITAMTKEGIIGKDNSLPWDIPEDLKYFKKTTENSVVIMGRKTWDSLPIKPLPNRINLVISNKYEELEMINDTTIMCNLKSAKKYAWYFEHINSKEVFIIGGAQIYKEFYELCDKLFITYVNDYYEGNILFPISEIEIYKDYETISSIKGDRCSFNILKRRR